MLRRDCNLHAYDHGGAREVGIVPARSNGLARPRTVSRAVVVACLLCAATLLPASAGAASFRVEFSGSGTFGGQAHLMEFGFAGQCGIPDIQISDAGSFKFDFLWQRVKLGDQIDFPSHSVVSGTRTTTVTEAPCGPHGNWIPGTRTCSSHFTPATHSTALGLARHRRSAALSVLGSFEEPQACVGNNDASANVAPPDPMDTPAAAFTISPGQLGRRTFTRSLDLAEALRSGALGADNAPLSRSCSGPTCREHTCETARAGKVSTTCSYAVNWTGRIRFTRLG